VFYLAWAGDGATAGSAAALTERAGDGVKTVLLPFTDEMM
jgi:hypothetical protein